jgi:cytochrome c oxidase subunit IV
MSKLSLYIGVWAALVTATIVEVVIRSVSASIFAVTVILVLIAAGKAVSIALYYQHLRYESRRLNVLILAALVGVTMLALSTAYTIYMMGM